MPTPSTELKRATLDSLLVFAPDLPSAKSFYCQVLGLAVHDETDGHLELRGGDVRLLIFKCDSESSPEGYSTRAGSSVAFGVSDLDAEFRRLRVLGVTVLHDEPASGPVGRYIAFTDPFGTVHELIETG